MGTIDDDKAKHSRHALALRTRNQERAFYACGAQAQAQAQLRSASALCRGQFIGGLVELQMENADYYAHDV